MALRLLRNVPRVLLLNDVSASQGDDLAPRRSHRSGAGSGGRLSQMEKICAALDPQVRKSQFATDLPEDALDNPLALERPRKGVRGQKQASHVIFSKNELINCIV